MLKKLQKCNEGLKKYEMVNKKALDQYAVAVTHCDENPPVMVLSPEFTAKSSSPVNSVKNRCGK